MIYSTVFLTAPFLSFLVFQQLHFMPSRIFALVYIILSLIYCSINREKIPSHFLKSGRHWFKLGSVIALGIIILISAFPIGGYIAAPLILPHSTENAKAVVVLASGATLSNEPSLAMYQRILHGAKLVKTGQAEHLYISTGFSELNGFAEYHTVASFVRMLDLPKDRVSIFKSKEITTTATEAAYIKRQLEEKGIKKVLLTTSQAHIYRSYLTFKKTGFEVYPAPSHSKKTVIYADNNLQTFRAAVHEWVGLAWYYINGRI